MNLLALKSYLYKINENNIINFASKNNIYLTNIEASQTLFFIKNHFDEIINCYNIQEYIYYYFSDPLAYKLYILSSIIISKYNWIIAN